MDFDLKTAAQLLGLPLPLARECKEANATQQRATQNISSESKASKPTMPSVLVRVKREKIDGFVPDENSDSELSDFESEKYIESAIQGNTRVEKDSLYGSTSAGLEYDHCGTGFEETKKRMIWKKQSNPRFLRRISGSNTVPTIPAIIVTEAFQNQKNPKGI